MRDYEEGNMEDDYSGGDIHLDGGTDRTGNGFMHCMKRKFCNNVTKNYLAA